MTPQEAIAILDDMQAQIIHGSTTMGEIADVMRDLVKRDERLRAFADLVWDARWPDSHQHDHLFGIAAEIRSGEFQSIDTALNSTKGEK